MTNKSETVPVPREQLQSLHDEMTDWQSPVAKELRRLLDGPAEDVRAVVEEPVAYLYKEYVWATGLCDYVWRTKLEAEAPTDHQNVKDIEPLYRHPQRPVGLPERIIGQQHGDKIAEAEQRGWNACLDAVEELNK